MKKEISERTQADATLKRRVLCIAKLKMATLEELVQIAEITGLLERVKTRNFRLLLIVTKQPQNCHCIDLHRLKAAEIGTTLDRLKRDR